MNNQIHSRSTVYGVHEPPGAGRLGQRGGCWRFTKLQRALFVLFVIASTLMLIGCSSSDDDGGDSETFSVGFRARDFRNVMPIVNGKVIGFPNGVMRATGSTTTLSVSGITTCTDATNCRGTFVLDGENADGEGDSGGETSCFFDFPSGSPDPLDRPRIDCNTCDLEVVEEDCVVVEGRQTQCKVRWLLAGTPSLETAPEDAAASEVFEVTLTIENGEVVAILDSGNVILEPEIDQE